jgi:glycerol-3-phosphate acyltransferase PlsX
MKIALDAMGGDFAPKNLVAGAVEALRLYSDVELILVGDESRLQAELKTHSAKLSDRLSIFHASQVVEMTDGAIEAVRRKKDSSISRAVELVADGKAEAVVTAGHTGALVAAAKIRLRSLTGVDRPALAALMPNGLSHFLVVDAGANVDCTSLHLLQFGIMGSVYARTVIGTANPRVGIMSNGTEEGKGSDLTRASFKLLSQTKLNFIGNVEGHDLFKESKVDVVVCDGFVGNIILKTSESLAKSISGWLRTEMQANPIRMLGGLLAYPAFQAIRARTNTDEYGGSPLLGVNGICIKAHGNSSPKAVQNAIRVAREAVTKQVNPLIIKEIAQHGSSSLS